jgi:hypothetical protein
MRNYQRLMKRYPRASYLLAITGLGVPALSLYLWIVERW